MSYRDMLEANSGGEASHQYINLIGKKNGVLTVTRKSLLELAGSRAASRHRSAATISSLTYERVHEVSAPAPVRVEK